MTTADQLLERLEAAERGATGPPPETGERVWTGIEDRLANGPAPPDIDDAPLLEQVPGELAINVGTSSSVVLKIVGVLAVVGAIGGAVALLSTGDRPPELVESVESAPVMAEAKPKPKPPEPALPKVVPAAVERAPAEPPAPAEPAPTEAPPSEPPAKLGKPSKPPAQPKSLADEMALMQTLSTALKQEDSSKVLTLVAEHERDFPKGQFIEERRAAKARALCRSSKLTAGKREAEAFASRWPDSIHLGFVKRDCGLQ